MKQSTDLDASTDAEPGDDAAADAENTHRVFDWLWTSGQISARDIAGLPGRGIEAVINLALPTSTNALPEEAALVTAQGLTYVHIPVPWEAPGTAQLAQFLGVLHLFEQRGTRVWVHCAKNMRVSAFVYLYRRLVRGEPDDLARTPLRYVWQPDATWQAFIDRALAADSSPSPDPGPGPGPDGPPAP